MAAPTRQLEQGRQQLRVVAIQYLGEGGKGEGGGRGREGRGRGRGSIQVVLGSLHSRVEVLFNGCVFILRVSVPQW